MILKLQFFRSSQEISADNWRLFLILSDFFMMSYKVVLVELAKTL